MKITMNVTSSQLKQETHKVYRKMRRFYWETDFINRCIDRWQEGTGLCNLPYETLPKEKKLLNLAYELYTDMEDSNTAYNVTLDLVIDEVERRIQYNQFCQDTITGSEVDI